MTIEFYQNEDRYWQCCPCGCPVNYTSLFARVDDGAGGWTEFTFTGDLNTPDGDDSGYSIYFTGDYGSGEVLLVWDHDALQWYINDGGFTFGGSTERCNPAGDYESVFEVSLTAF